jgi:hypothetical protein
VTPPDPARLHPQHSEPVAIALPEGVLRVRVGPGANCSSAGSAVDVLFYGSAIAGALAVALAAAFAPRPPQHSPEPGDDKHEPGDAD